MAEKAKPKVIGSEPGKVRATRVRQGKTTHPAESARRGVSRQRGVSGRVKPAGADFDKLLVLTTSSHKPEGQMSPMEKMHMADRGVTKKDLESLKGKTALDYDDLAQVLSVGRATLLNKKGNEKFSPLLSEKIVGLADLYSYGYEVFEDKDRFNQWMLRPNRALGGQAPLSLIHNQFGREEVRHVIGRIDYGVYS